MGDAEDMLENHNKENVSEVSEIENNVAEEHRPSTNSLKEWQTHNVLKEQLAQENVLKRYMSQEDVPQETRGDVSEGKQLEDSILRENQISDSRLEQMPHEGVLEEHDAHCDISGKHKVYNVVFQESKAKDDVSKTDQARDKVLKEHQAHVIEELECHDNVSVEHETVCDISGKDMTCSDILEEYETEDDVSKAGQVQDKILKRHQVRATVIEEHEFEDCVLEEGKSFDVLEKHETYCDISGKDKSHNVVLQEYVPENDVSKVQDKVLKDHQTQGNVIEELECHNNVLGEHETRCDISGKDKSHSDVLQEYKGDNDISKEDQVQHEVLKEHQTQANVIEVLQCHHNVLEKHETHCDISGKDKSHSDVLQEYVPEDDVSKVQDKVSKEHQVQANVIEELEHHNNVSEEHETHCDVSGKHKAYSVVFQECKPKDDVSKVQDKVMKEHQVQANVIEELEHHNNVSEEHETHCDVSGKHKAYSVVFQECKAKDDVSKVDVFEEDKSQKKVLREYEAEVDVSKGNEIQYGVLKGHQTKTNCVENESRGYVTKEHHTQDKVIVEHITHHDFPEVSQMAHSVFKKLQSQVNVPRVSNGTGTTDTAPTEVLQKKKEILTERTKPSRTPKPNPRYYSGEYVSPFTAARSESESAVDAGESGERQYQGIGSEVLLSSSSNRQRGKSGPKTMTVKPFTENLPEHIMGKYWYYSLPSNSRSMPEYADEASVYHGSESHQDTLPTPNVDHDYGYNGLYYPTRTEQYSPVTKRRRGRARIHPQNHIRVPKYESLPSDMAYSSEYTVNDVETASYCHYSPPGGDQYQTKRPQHDSALKRKRGQSRIYKSNRVAQKYLSCPSTMTTSPEYNEANCSGFSSGSSPDINMTPNSSQYGDPSHLSMQTPQYRSATGRRRRGRPRLSGGSIGRRPRSYNRFISGRHSTVPYSQENEGHCTGFSDVSPENGAEYSGLGKILPASTYTYQKEKNIASCRGGRKQRRGGLFLQRTRGRLRISNGTVRGRCRVQKRNKFVRRKYDDAVPEADTNKIYFRPDEVVSAKNVVIKDCFVALEKLDFTIFQQPVSHYNYYIADEILSDPEASSSRSESSVFNGVTVLKSDIKETYVDDDMLGLDTSLIYSLLDDLKAESGMIITSVQSSADDGDAPVYHDITGLQILDLRDSTLGSLDTAELHERDETESAPPTESVTSDILNIGEHEDIQDSTNEVMPTEEESKDLFKKYMSPCNGTNGWKCFICGKSYPVKRTLTLHVSTVHGPRKYKCSVCRVSFKRKHHLMQHKLFHFNEKRFTCEHCKKSYALFYSLKLHLLSNHSGEKHVCDICNKSYTLKNNLNRHKITHTRPNKHVCNYCGMSFPYKFYLRSHVRTHNSDKYHCDACDELFVEKSDLKHHLKQAHPALFNNRKAESVSVDNIESHKPYSETEQLTSNVPSQESELSGCSYSEETETSNNLSSKEEGVSYHSPSKEGQSRSTCRLEKVASTKRFLCKICCKQFRVKSKMINHVKQTHRNFNGYRRKMRDRSDLNAGGESYEVNRKFQQQLKTKRSIKTALQKYFCKICRKCYLTKKRCQRHLEEHKKRIEKYRRKIFYCEVCQANFPDKFILHKHLLTHNGSTAICLYCYKPFTFNFVHRKGMEMEIFSNYSHYFCDGCQKHTNDQLY